jgi:hypothetical protein
MLFKEIIAFYYENHKEYINTLCTKNTEFLMLKFMVHIVTGVF